MRQGGAGRERKEKKKSVRRGFNDWLCSGMRSRGEEIGAAIGRGERKISRDDLSF